MMMGYHSPDYPVMGNDPRITRTWGIIKAMPRLTRFVYCYIYLPTGEYRESTSTEIAKAEGIVASKVSTACNNNFILLKKYKFLNRKYVYED